MEGAILLARPVTTKYGLSPHCTGPGEPYSKGAGIHLPRQVRVELVPAASAVEAEVVEEVQLSWLLVTSPEFTKESSFKMLLKRAQLGN